MTGRPSTFTEEAADEIVTRMAQGESLRSICRDDHMPPLSTVIGWQAQHETFAVRCARAREAQAEDMDGRVMSVAERVEAGELDPQAARVALAAYQWRASKLAPKRYGDKTLLTGADGESAPQVEITVRFG